MEKILLFELTLAAVIAILIAYFFYAYKAKKKNYILLSLRALGLFLIALLFINPSFNKKSYTLQKPTLAVFVDNSASINYLKRSGAVKNALQTFQSNKALNTKYTIDYYQFGESLTNLDSLTFDVSNTKITTVLDYLSKTNKTNTKAVLITDGNQTQGDDYISNKINTPIIPLVVGDTMHYTDLKIGLVNTNKYSYIKNRFPVEIFTNYSGNKTVQTQLNVYHKGKLLASENLHFSNDKKSHKTTFQLASKYKGLQTFTLKLKPFTDEKNTKNNTKQFAVSIIDNKRKIALVSATVHPDVALFKRSIEANEQLEVTIKKPSDKIDVNAYQLLILYQPNRKFEVLFSGIKKYHKNYFIISGAHTDWQFLNAKQAVFSKKPSALKETIFASEQAGFDAFQFQNIAFETFPPLLTNYGKVSINAENKTILNQKINDVVTNYPMLTLVNTDGQKQALWDGEGMWKWRLAHFKAKQNFNDFDTFMVDMIQYLSSNKEIDRLAITYDKSYFQHDNINIVANFVDENYAFDANKTLILKLISKTTKQAKTYQFLLDNQQYKLTIDGLAAGDYSFTVLVSGTSFKKIGQFTVLDFDIEKQFATANYTKLSQLANQTNSKPFLLSETAKLLTKLENEKHKPIQKETVVKTALIDWKWLLPLLFLVFSLEWFIRKYTGLV